MGWTEYDRFRHNGGHKRKFRKVEDKWYRVNSKWEARVLEGKGMDVLVVRSQYRQAVLGTMVAPKGTFRLMGVEAQLGLIMGLIRRQAKTGANGQVLSPKPETMVKEFPNLTGYLFETEYEDGETRQRSTLTIMAGDVYGIKMVLNDRQEGASLWSTGSDIDDALLAMEEQLDKVDAPWRKDVRRPAGKKS